MHDPSTVAFDIKYPWSNRHGYRNNVITIWHDDPETDGSDDSCGWFMRSRHGDKAVVERIVKRFESDWDRTFKSDDTGHLYFCGLFSPAGAPHLSPIGITVNLFFLAAFEHFGSRDGAERFLQNNLLEIVLFAENPTDSLHDSITLKFGGDSDREDRIRRMAHIVYGWILRKTRPWYRHPRWHLWHWRIQLHPWQQFRRWLFTRCERCGRGFRYGESPHTNNWDTPRIRWFRSEVGLYHGDCHGLSADKALLTVPGKSPTDAQLE